MALSWLRQLCNRIPQAYRASRLRGLADKQARPILEVLEGRLAPATHTWTGAAGGGDLNWGTDGNWVGGAPVNGEAGPIILNFPAVAAGLKAMARRWARPTSTRSSRRS